mmetsp:Transcript_39438/g.29128  ORF Transcript_39438/g.29128 Transcript_39438/m.29128 type:complete len:276 (-) Transcript_39438:25-852(-)
MDEYADQVLLMLPAPRYEWYSHRSFTKIGDGVTDHVNTFLDKFGFYPLVSQLFVLKAMEYSSLGLIFLELIFAIIMTIFIVIAVLLIYSLLLIRLEARSLETGIMRMVGLSKQGLVVMVFMQCAMFVLPSIIFGFVCCVPLIYYCNDKVFGKEQVDGVLPLPSGAAVFEALLVGLLVPFFSSIVPLYRVLGQNLTEALNYERSKNKAIYVEVLQKSKVDVIPYIAFGTLAVVYGVSIFNLLPYSLVSLNLSLLLQILFFILLGIFLGLILLTINA